MYELRMLNYLNEESYYGIRLDLVNKIDVEVLTGDEIFTIYYVDGSNKKIDTGIDTRVIDYYDLDYCAYDKNKEDNLIFNDKWANRKTSYSFHWHNDDDDMED